MHPGPQARRPSTYLLLGAFIAVALSYLAVTAYTHWISRQIDVATDDIADNSSPSIQHLAAFRVYVAQLDHLLAHHLGLFPEPMSGRSEVESVLTAVGRNVHEYLALPRFPGEQGYCDEVENSLAELTRATHRIMALADAGDHDAARAAYLSELRPAVSRGVDAAMRGIEFNARYGHDAAIRIKAVRRHALWVGLVLDLLCLAVAALAGLIVRWEVRRHGELLESYARLAEERSRELEFFAGRVAHDIVNPVSAAQIGVQMALRQNPADAQTCNLLERAGRSLDRVQAMVDGLLRFARAGAKPTPGSFADVPRVVEDVMKALAESEQGSGIGLEWHAAPCGVACDVGVLTSILSNLVQNAAKYIGERPDRRIIVRAVRHGSRVHIDVEDSGNGLPPDLIGRVFEPYVRGAGHSRPGLGLGLATVKRLVEGHGGRVGVVSDPGQGCTFWLELPAAELNAPTAAGAARAV